MLKRVIIEGFQSHEHTELDFNNLTNVVRGDNDSGKSAIRRAILWVLTNKPSGTAFINWNFPDSKPCVVTIEYNDHKVIRRRSRDSKVNEYEVDGEILRAFGQGVPPIIEEIFTLDDTNIELQHSALFMLSESAPDMARRLNKLTNLEDIDKAYSIIRKRKADASRTLKDEESRRDDTVTALEKFHFVTEAEGVAEELKIEYNKLPKLLEDIEVTTNLLEGLQEARGLPTIEVESKAVGELIRALGDASTAVSDVDGLKGSLDAIVIHPHFDIELSALEKHKEELVIADVNKQAVKQLMADIDEIGILVRAPISSKAVNIDAFKSVIDEYMEVDRLMCCIKEAKTNVTHSEAMLAETRIEYDVLMPEECPLCGAITRRA